MVSSSHWWQKVTRPEKVKEIAQEDLKKQSKEKDEVKTELLWHSFGVQRNVGRKFLPLLWLIGAPLNQWWDFLLILGASAAPQMHWMSSSG